MKLSIDNPCHKEWNKMLPNETGAFCLSCTKNVIDFTTKTIDEIKTFFIEKPETEEVCGRFVDHQFTALAFDDFFRRFMKWKYFQKTALIVFFIFGLSLFGNSQNTPINVPLVTVGTVAYFHQDSTKKVNKKDTLHKQSKVKGKNNSTKPKTKEEPVIMGDIMVEDKK